MIFNKYSHVQTGVYCHWSCITILNLSLSLLSYYLENKSFTIYWLDHINSLFILLICFFILFFQTGVKIWKKASLNLIFAVLFSDRSTFIDMYWLKLVTTFNEFDLMTGFESLKWYYSDIKLIFAYQSFVYILIYFWLT